jgi:hypothetical protein
MPFETGDLHGSWMLPPVWILGFCGDVIIVFIWIVFLTIYIVLLKSQMYEKGFDYCASFLRIIFELFFFNKIFLGGLVAFGTRMHPDGMQGKR